VSLTAGTGPFGERPAGRFDVEMPDRVLFLDPVPQRIRGLRRGEVVVDSSAAGLLHETGRLPVYWFRGDDVRHDLLEPGQVETRDEPLLEGLVSVRWDAMDEWFAEDAQLFGHPRDPYSRIDVFPTSRRVRVLVDGVALADSIRSRALYETALPPRFYLPPEDVRLDLLEPSPHRTRCAYKGSASYWHARVGDRLVENLAWAYHDPHHDAEPVRDLLCFFNERVDLELDGTVGERPISQWSA
jgi:uncharacterized protein (DUF427 family)